MHNAEEIAELRVANVKLLLRSIHVRGRHPFLRELRPATPSRLTLLRRIFLSFLKNGKSHHLSGDDTQTKKDKAFLGT